MESNSSNRSPSPMSTRPNPNPNPNYRSNNLEKEGNGFKKSLNGYPFVKSSSIYQQKEYARRSSLGRDSGGFSFRDHEQKENERDHIVQPATRTKSPSIIAKGTKHFMSPTISAASKINPSPRKKVLGERNEAIRTSASLSDGRFHFFSTNSLDFENEMDTKSSPMSINKAENEPDKANNEPDKHEFGHPNGFNSSNGRVKNTSFEADLVVLSPEVPKNTVKSFESLPMNTVKSSESLPLSEMPEIFADHIVDSGTKTDTYSSPCTKIPHEVDPFLPPYDPKNNYLSPRPQFLHYNPSWRTENHVNQGMNLEDDFTSESVDEVDNSSEEEVQSENSSSSVGKSPKEVPQLSLEANVTKSQQLIEMVEPELEPNRSRGLTNWKVAAVLLLFSIGFMLISFTYCPAIGNAIHRDEIISHIYNNPHTAALVGNFKGLVKNAKIRSVHSVDYLSQMIQNMNGVEKFSPLKYVNLTAWQEEENWGHVVKEFDLKSYFGRIEDGYCELESAQIAAQMQVYTEFEGGDFQPEVKQFQETENEDHETSDRGDNLSEEVLQVYETDDEVSTQMQSFPTPVDKMIELDDCRLEEVTQSSEIGVQAELVAEIDFESDQVKEEFLIADNDGVMAEQELSLDEPEIVVKVVAESSPSPPQVPQNQPEAITSTEQSEKTDMSPADNVSFMDKSSPSPPQVPENQPEAITSSEQSEKTDMSPADDVSFMDKATDQNSQLLGKSEKRIAPITVAVVLVIASLIGFFMYMKSKKVGPLADQSVAETNNRKNATSNMKLPICEVDMIDSFPSEMSSLQNSIKQKQNNCDEAQTQQKCSKSNYKIESLASSLSEYTMNSTKQKGNSGDEAYSQQKSSKRNYKRESLAASSSEYTMNSSYGSFGTYSIIHPKHGDDEVITPVRRSSRLRGKVTSP